LGSLRQGEVFFIGSSDVHPSRLLVLHHLVSSDVSDFKVERMGKECKGLHWNCMHIPEAIDKLSMI